MYSLFPTLFLVALPFFSLPAIFLLVISHSLLPPWSSTITATPQRNTPPLNTYFSFLLLSFIFSFSFFLFLHTIPKVWKDTYKCLISITPLFSSIKNIQWLADFFQPLQDSKLVSNFYKQSEHLQANAQLYLTKTTYKSAYDDCLAKAKSTNLRCRTIKVPY